MSEDEDSEIVTVYRPNQRHDRGFVRTWVLMARNIWRARELIGQLFRRDFLATYRKSFLGLTWIVLTPLFGILSWVFLRGTGMLNPGDVGIPYPAYVLVGTTLWGLFLGVFTASSQTLLAGQALIMQVYYPHEALLFKQSAEQLARFLVALVLNLAVLAAFRVVPSWGVILLPLVVLPLILLAAGLGLIVSLFSVVAVDLSTFLTLGMGLVMFLTPVIYSESAAPAAIRPWIEWNPLTYLVGSGRDIMIYGRLYHPAGYAASAALAVGVFLASWRLFFVSEDRVVERMI